jgi:hypothetical protein
MRDGVAVALAPVVLASALLSFLFTGCTDGEVSGSAAGSGGAGGSGSSGDGGSSPSAGGSTAGDGGATSTPAAGPSTGPGGTSSSEASGPTSSSSASSTVTVAASTSTTGGGEDEYAEEREICVAKINELRATEGLPAYGRWGDAEQCNDDGATSDEQTNTPHGSFGTCGESAQNECLGHGPAGVAACLEQMWAEKDQAGCAGCVDCHAGQGACENCDFYGDQTGDVCGHYVNMSALYFSEVACGFSALGGWDVQNFR